MTYQSRYDMYDTDHCPRCGRKGLRYEGYLYESGDFPGGGDLFSCVGCDGWFSVIELPPRPRHPHRPPRTKRT